MEPSLTEPEAALPPPAIRPPRPTLQRVVAWSTVAVLCAVSVLLGLICAFLLPPIVDPELVPRLVFTFGVALVGNFLAAMYAVRTTGSRAAALVTAGAWLISALYLALGRGEGDSVYLMQTYQGILLAPAAMLGATMGLARGYRRPWPRALGQDRARSADN